MKMAALLRHVAGSHDDRGTAIVEFIAGLTLLVTMFLLVAQAAVYVYVENVAVAAAYEGSRHGAAAGEGVAAARARAAGILQGALGGYARQLNVEVSGEHGVVETVIDGGIEPLFPLLPRLPISARARVLSEDGVLV